MGTRLELQQLFESLLGSRNVYYNPPATVEMKYDAIRYALGNPESKYANNIKYLKLKCYEGVVISKKPDPKIIEKLEDLPYVSFSKPYKADNLNHYPFTIYY